MWPLTAVARASHVLRAARNLRSSIFDLQSSIQRGGAMSSWASRDVGSGGQGRVASWLGKVPGYSGYKNKETRRDEDKRVREELAREYGQYAQRLTDLQGELVRSHRLTDIGT